MFTILGSKLRAPIWSLEEEENLQFALLQHLHLNSDFETWNDIFVIHEC